MPLERDVSARFDSRTVTATGVTAPAADIARAGGSLVGDDARRRRRCAGDLAGGTLSGAGTLNVSDSFSWTDGSMTATGQTVLGTGAVGTLAAGTGSLWFDQRTLVNRGTLTWSSEASWVSRTP